MHNILYFRTFFSNRKVIFENANYRLFKGLTSLLTPIHFSYEVKFIVKISKK